MPIVLAFLLPCLKKMCVLEVKLFSNFVGASDAGQIQTSHRHPGFYIPAQPLRVKSYFLKIVVTLAVIFERRQFYVNFGFHP